jgi:antitoxin VapB
VAFHVRNKETEVLTRELARRTNLGLTEAVRLAVKNELARHEARFSLWERTASLREDIRRRIKDPAPVGKTFRDSLYE